MRLNYFILLIVSFFSSLHTIGQTPQHVDQGKGKGISIWESNEALITVIVIVVILYITRRWSKNIHRKRDEVSKKNNEKNND